MIKTRFKPNNRSKHKPNDQHKFKETKYDMQRNTCRVYLLITMGSLNYDE